jgi:hypothetical protein
MEELSPCELELCLVRTEFRALVKRWRFNLTQNSSERQRSKKELIELMCAQIETILEGGR